MINTCLDIKYYIDVIRHKLEVFISISKIVVRLFYRGIVHDMSFFNKKEVEIFSKVPVLSEISFGSKEYENRLKKLEKALKHHYKNNPQHPEHSPFGINDMDLIEIIEMVADWKSSIKKQRNGLISNTMKYNTNRYKIDEQLAKIIHRTLLEI